MDTRYEDDPDVQQVISEFKLGLESKIDRDRKNPSVDPELTMFDEILVSTIQSRR